MHTLEAIMAATLMVVIIIFAVQATSLTPLTSSTANAHIESQMYMMGQDMLTALDHSPNGQNSDLKDAIIEWDGERYVWDGNKYKSDENESNILSGPVVDMFELSTVRNGIAHNLQFTYIDEEGSETTDYIYNGEPSDNAVIVSRKVLISDSDIENYASYIDSTKISDIDNTTALYNIIDVKLTLWRM
ncbi:hypothetical protein MCMEM_1699 [Methanococcoides methylutens MM1]|uniref:Uncharacterized protein n=2 Tax=Methanococcoides methylutens TaxID=2226 RepID=A0A0E3ST75_METMT|nr:hypothetical protein MCMEM_1699 [Methanococcoides methylutens MM1]